MQLETKQPRQLESESVNNGYQIEERDDLYEHEGKRLARLKVNIFYMISAICSLALVGYAWFVFLPSFQGATEYPSIMNVVILLTVLLLIVSAIQIVLSLKPEETSSDDETRGPE